MTKIFMIFFTLSLSLSAFAEEKPAADNAVGKNCNGDQADGGRGTAAKADGTTGETPKEKPGATEVK